jgi:hypothetical protein
MAFCLSLCRPLLGAALFGTLGGVVLTPAAWNLVHELGLSGVSAPLAHDGVGHQYCRLISRMKIQMIQSPKVRKIMNTSKMKFQNP